MLKAYERCLVMTDMSIAAVAHGSGARRNKSSVYEYRGPSAAAGGNSDISQSPLYLPTCNAFSAESVPSAQFPRPAVGLPCEPLKLFVQKHASPSKPQQQQVAVVAAAGTLRLTVSASCCSFIIEIYETYQNVKYASYVR